MAAITRDLCYHVEKAFNRLENLHQCDLPYQEKSSELVAELNTALHELQTATVELLEQNEELTTSRQALEEEQYRYQELFEFAPDGYLVSDTEGIILEANTASTHLLNESKAFLIGKPLAMLVQSDERLSFRTRLAQIKKGNSVLNGDWELLMTPRKGPAFPASITVGAVLTSRGKTAELRWLLRDITKRKQMEEELQKADKLESLGILAGGIAHDFNNFLTVILGNLSLVKMYINEDSKATMYLKDMETATKQTGNLSRQLLAFAKGWKPLTEAVSLHRLIEEVCTFALSGSNTHCEFALAEDLPSVEIDSGQITQVISNLLINADQSMPAGGTIKISAQLVSATEENGNHVLPLQPGNYVALTIEDEGTGVSSQTLPKIFDPYFTTKDEGNGLGLTICYTIMKKHGGHISVQSVEGKGTSFTLYLPVSSNKAKDVDIEDPLLYGEGRVLLMEDQESVRQAAGQMLSFLGYEVEFAGDGAEAVRLYQEALHSEHPFDVVLSDLTIRGGMGGNMTVSELIKVNPDVKAIVSSGYSYDATLADYKKHGFSDVIAKPYTLQELDKVLSRVLQKKKWILPTLFYTLSGPFSLLFINNYFISKTGSF